ncbi:hypothetical protein [Dermatophilus congolensis]|nr:hypothetical protein [Dermatophilus congolensis]
MRSRLSSMLPARSSCPAICAARSVTSLSLAAEVRRAVLAFSRSWVRWVCAVCSKVRACVVAFSQVSRVVGRLLPSPVVVAARVRLSWMRSSSRRVVWASRRRRSRSPPPWVSQSWRRFSAWVVRSWARVSAFFFGGA